MPVSLKRSFIVFFNYRSATYTCNRSEKEITLTPLVDEIRKHYRSASQEPCRLFHGRGRTVPGYEFLVIDWYPPLAMVTLYESRNAAWLEKLKLALVSILGQNLQGISFQNRHRGDDNRSSAYGTVPKQMTVREDGLCYMIFPQAQQNIGFFPDMKNGRRLVRSLSSGKKVLNLFAYTCAFSVAAIAGGAREVVNLDMNRNLLDRGKTNHRLNNQDLRQVSFLPHNLFKTFGELKKRGPFDLVILDPPCQQGRSFRAHRDWPRIIKRLPGLLAGNGDIVAAVSAPELGRSFLRQQFTDNLPQAELRSELTAGSEFPELAPDKGLQIQHYRL